MSLNVNQKKFCRNYINTGLVKQSYIDAGYSPTNADVASSRLFNQPEIKAEIARLNEEVDTTAIMSKKERQQWLTRNANQAEEKGDIKAGVSCIAEMNKMDGAYQPEKKELELSGSLDLSTILSSLEDTPLS